MIHESVGFTMQRVLDVLELTMPDEDGRDILDGILSQLDEAFPFLLLESVTIDSKRRSRSDIAF